MCHAEGMGIAPWEVIGGGKFKTEAQLEAGIGRQSQPTGKDIKISEVSETVAERKDTTITSIAQAYVM